MICNIYSSQLTFSYFKSEFCDRYFYFVRPWFWRAFYSRTTLRSIFCFKQIFKSEAPIFLYLNLRWSTTVWISLLVIFLRTIPYSQRCLIVIHSVMLTHEALLVAIIMTIKHWMLTLFFLSCWIILTSNQNVVKIFLTKLYYYFQKSYSTLRCIQWLWKSLLRFSGMIWVEDIVHKPNTIVMICNQ